MERRKKEVKSEDKPCCTWLNPGIIPGVILLGLGLMFFLSDIGYINLNWSYVPLGLGIIFLLAYLASRTWAFLIPGVILSGIGLILVLNVEEYGFLYTASVALSFFTVYLTRAKSTSWAIIPGMILAAVSLVIGFEEFTNINAFPIILICAGAYLLYKSYSKKR